MRITDDDLRDFFFLEAMIGILKGPVEEFIEASTKSDFKRLLTLYPFVTQGNTLRIAQQKVVFRSIHDPVEDWESALEVLQQASKHSSDYPLGSSFEHFCVSGWPLVRQAYYRSQRHGLAQVYH